MKLFLALVLIITHVTAQAEFSCKQLFARNTHTTSQLFHLRLLYSPLFYQALSELAEVTETDPNSLELFIGNTELTRADYYEFSRLILMYILDNMEPGKDGKLPYRISLLAEEEALADIQTTLMSLSTIDFDFYLKNTPNLPQDIQVDRGLDIAGMTLHAGSVASVAAALATVGAAFTQYSRELESTPANLTGLAVLAAAGAYGAYALTLRHPSLIDAGRSVSHNIRNTYRALGPRRTATQLWLQGLELRDQLPYSLETSYDFVEIYERFRPISKRLLMEYHNHILRQMQSKTQLGY